MNPHIKSFISADLSTSRGKAQARQALRSCFQEANRLNMVPRKHSLLMRILLAIVHFFQLLLVVWPIFIFTKKLVKSKQPSHRILLKTITQESIDQLTEEQLTSIRFSIVNQQNSDSWNNADRFLNLISNVAVSPVTTPVSNDWWSLWVIKGKKDFKSLKEASPGQVYQLAQRYPNIREFSLMSQYYQLTSSGSTDPASISRSVSSADWDKNDDTALIQILDHVEKLQTPRYVDTGNNRLIQVMQRKFSYLGKKDKREIMQGTELEFFSNDYWQPVIDGSIMDPSSNAVFSDTLCQRLYPPVSEASQECRKFSHFTHDVLKGLGLSKIEANYAHFPMTTVFGYKLFSKKNDAPAQEEQFIKDATRQMWNMHRNELGQDPMEIDKATLGVKEMSTSDGGVTYTSQQSLSAQQKAVRFISQSVGAGDLQLMQLYCKKFGSRSYSRSYHDDKNLIFEYVTVFYPSLNDNDVAIVSNKFKFRPDGHIELECYAHIPKGKDLWPIDKFQRLLSWLDSQMRQKIGLSSDDKVLSLDTKSENYRTQQGGELPSMMAESNKEVIEKAVMQSLPPARPRSGADSPDISLGSGM